MASVNGQRFVPACHQGFTIGSSMIYLTPSDLTQIDWWIGLCICLSDVGCLYIDDYQQRSNQESALFMWNSEKSRRNDSLGQSGKKGEVKQGKKGGESGKNL